MTSPDILARRKAIALTDTATALLDGEPVTDEEREQRLEEKVEMGIISAEPDANAAELIAVLASQYAQLRRRVDELEQAAPKKTASKKKTA